MPNQKPNQSISINGSNLSGIQIGQAGRDQTQNNYIAQSYSSNKLSVQEVIQLLEGLEAVMQRSNFTGNEQKKAARYLESAKDAIQESEPNKSFAASNLKEFVKVLKATDESISAGQSILNKAKPILKKLAPWLGVAAGFLI